VAGADGAPAACVAPQLGQKAALSATAAPHFVQCGINPPGPRSLLGRKPSKTESGLQAHSPTGSGTATHACSKAVNLFRTKFPVTTLNRGLPVAQIQQACIIEGASPRGSGGIGRRASLRSWWPKGRRGSSPFFRRIFSQTQINRSVHLIGRVDARDRLPYTEISLAVNARRTSLLCSWNLERVKGKLGQGLH
jgi:hypothetical protein